MTDRRFVRRRARRGLVALSTLALALVLLPGGFAARSSSRAAMAAPLGFQPQTVVSGLNLPTSFAFTPDGRIFIAEKNGAVRVFKNGALLATPLIDISAKVNNYWDRGLIGMALDPNFTTNGFVYLLYPYDASPTDDAGTKTSRLSRYTVVGDTASPSTEKIILGTNVGSACTQFPVGSDCIPAEWYGHGVGDIHFGSDGSMFLSNGDAANWDIVSDEAARAQDLNSLAGKIMRVDPSTGQGLPDNPYWNGDPNAARSKVWAYGVRNAYRFSVRPNSGAPGTVYAGDVGWGTAEEVNVVPKGANLGWPCYEGSAVQAGYQFKPVCQALYTTVAADPSKWTKPIITWDHNGAGSAVTGGAFNTGTAYPAAYQGVYFFGDYARNQLRYASIDTSGVVTSGPTDFDLAAGSPVDIQVGPDGNLYYLAIASGQLIKYVYGAPPPSGSGGFLSDLAWTSATNGWGPVEKDKSNGEQGAGDGGPITLNGVAYPKGLGTHAASEVRYGISGCTNFSSDIGIDDEAGVNGSVVFQVYLDGTKAYDSGTMNGASVTKSVSLDLTGKSELRLVVTNGGDNNDYDHADWANAQLACTGTGGGAFTVASVSPADGATGVAPSSNVTATFSADVDQSTVNSSTVMLKQGSTPVPAQLSYNAATRTVTLDPTSDLQAGLTYAATVAGGPSGVKDIAGNALVSSRIWSFTIAPAGGGGTATSYLSDLTWTSSTNGWGPVEKDRSNGEQGAGDGGPITLNTIVYPKGLGTHAASDVRYAISGCTSFQTDIGLDDEVGPNGSAVFRVYLDGTIAYDSGTMTGSTATKTINLDVTGKSELRIVVTNGGDTVDYDHADWANARITCGGGSNQPPIPTITSPTSSTTFVVNDVINFQGAATDPEDGNLPPSALTWQINLQHCIGTTCHTHFLITQDGAAGSFTVPNHGDMYHFDLTLTATDSSGATRSTTVTILPRTVQLTLASNPTGLQVIYGGTSATAPVAVSEVQGATVTISALSPQGSASFSSWSDGGAQQHNVTLGTTDATYTANFTTPQPLSVTSVTPANGATGVAPSSNVTATFSADMNQTTVNGSTFTLKQGTTAVPAVVTYNTATRTATVDPTTDLQSGLVYTATVMGGASGVQDTSGNTLANSGTWSFTTSQPLSVTSVTPANGATGVAPSSNVTATFSADMNQTTVNGSTFTLKQGTTAVPAVVTYNTATRTATVDPTTDLQSGLVYTATVMGGASGVQDTSGNTLANSGTWSFTTTAGGGGPTTRYLSDLTWTSATNGFGPVERDKSNGEAAAGDGKTITLNGTTYPKGLGAHANSDIRFNIAGKCTAFNADIGVDDEVGKLGSVIFRVFLDGTKAYDSGTMTGSTATKSISVNSTGKSELRIYVDLSTNGNSSDHADWANARITCTS